MYSGDSLTFSGKENPGFLQERKYVNPVFEFIQDQLARQTVRGFLITDCLRKRMKTSAHLLFVSKFKNLKRIQFLLQSLAIYSIHTSLQSFSL